jgi:hypothetical protein
MKPYFRKSENYTPNSDYNVDVSVSCPLNASVDEIMDAYSIRRNEVKEVSGALVSLPLIRSLKLSSRQA